MLEHQPPVAPEVIQEQDSFQSTFPFAIVRQNGEIAFFGKTMDLPPLPEGCEFVSEEPPGLDCYWDGAAFQTIPASPGPSFVFDYATKAWLDPRPLLALKEAKNQLIEAERDRRRFLPIAYDGRSVDADKQAQSNITDKISEIAGREAGGSAMPQDLMVWRDADNNNKTFASMADMKAWLQGLTVIIAQRGTEAYVWSWEAKAQVDAATTPEELALLELGWPEWPD